MDELEAWIAEVEEQERIERAKLIAQGVDPALLDEFEAEMVVRANVPPTPEERATFAAIYETLKR